jgi:prepilin-type N-terminal cleavage/methylation domain-containing protein
MKRNNGFSLIEVMVGLGILSVGIFAMISLFSTSHHMLSIGNQDTRAAHLAQNKMEVLRATRPLIKVDATRQEIEPGMQANWSVLPKKDQERLWVITVTVFPVGKEDRSVLLKSLVFY